MFNKAIKLLVITLLAYLLQATAAEYISIWNVAPNIALALVAIISVAMGRKYTFVMALTIGYLLEIMLATLDYMNLILYPVSAMLGALMFSDKSERKLEEEHSTGRRSLQLVSILRTPLCAMLSTAVFEGVNLIYIYLSGVTLDSGHWTRMLISVVYTMLITAVLQFPVRYWLRMQHVKKAR